MAEYRTVQTGTSPFQFYPSERLVEANTGLPNSIHLSELDRLLLGITQAHKKGATSQLP